MLQVETGTPIKGDVKQIARNIHAHRPHAWKRTPHHEDSNGEQELCYAQASADSMPDFKRLMNMSERSELDELCR
jgi:hypothetical protein